jgi:hypothetical protein
MVGSGFGWGNDAGYDRWEGVGWLLHAGHTFTGGLYFGTWLEAFDGKPLRSDTETRKGSILDLGIEAGYDLAMATRWVLRGKLGLGSARLRDRECVITPPATQFDRATKQCTTKSPWDTLLSVGSSILYFGEPFVLLLDARRVMVLRGDHTAHGTIITLGLGLTSG